MTWNTDRPRSARATQAMRTRVLREQPTCAIAWCGAASTEDDHIVPWSQRVERGLSVEQWQALENHQGLCSIHHREKTQREAMAKRTSDKRPVEAHPGLKAVGTPSPTPTRSPDGIGVRGVYGSGDSGLEPLDVA